MSWSKKGGFLLLALAVTAAVTLLMPRREVWHSLADIDQN